MSTFVLVGNAKQPFHRLLRAVEEFAGQLPQPVVVQHGHTPFSSARCEAHRFLERDQAAALIGSARLVISHAGAGSVIEAVAAGQLPVVMPRRRALGEHIDDHQVEFAQMLRLAGKAIVIHEASELRSAVGEALGRTRQTLGSHEPALVGHIREILRGLDGVRSRT